MKFSTFTPRDQTTEAPGKRLTLDCTGEISKQTVGALTRSKVNTIDGDLRLLEQILNEAPSYVHLTSGVSPYDEALAVPAYQVALEAKRMKFEDASLCL